MTRSPLFRACVALRLPRGLYCYNARADVPLTDAEIRLALRRQHVATERLTLALADTFERLGDGRDAIDVWYYAGIVVKDRDLPASMVGALAFAAMLPDEGAIEPDEWGFMVEAAP